MSTTRISQTAFVSGSIGFAIYSGNSGGLLASTHDGGRSWQSLGLPGFSSTNEVDGLVFTDLAHGYLWGNNLNSSGAPAGTPKQLMFSSDGGNTWTQVAGIDHVVAARLVGATVEVLTSTVVYEGGSGAGWLWTTPAAAPRWRRAEQPLPAGSEVDAVAFDADGTTYVEAHRQSPRRADMTPTSLIVTHNGGASWSTETTPCVTEPSWAEPVGSYTSGDVWMFCNFEASAGSQPKTLYRSRDDGTTWTLESSSAGGATAAVGNLPVAGYPEQLFAESDTHAYLEDSRYALLETHDGGRTWAPATPPGDDITAVSITGPHSGYLLVDDNPYVTTDGTTWHRLTN